ncbi:MAG: HXXEE domain-containing protein, partial [bacterium]
MWRWLVWQWQWPAAAIFTAIFLLALAPLVNETEIDFLTIIYLQLPIYLIHQAEEHLHDRFRNHINHQIGHGAELLTRPATFLINFIGVWVYDITAILLASRHSIPAGLACGYLSFVNGIIHLVSAIKDRQSNPGLISAIFLLIPFGAYCVMQVGAEASPADHLAGV